VKADDIGPAVAILQDFIPANGGKEIDYNRNRRTRATVSLSLIGSFAIP